MIGSLESIIKNIYFKIYKNILDLVENISRFKRIFCSAGQAGLSPHCEPWQESWKRGINVVCKHRIKPGCRDSQARVFWRGYCKESMIVGALINVPNWACGLVAVNTFQSLSIIITNHFCIMTSHDGHF